MLEKVALFANCQQLNFAYELLSQYFHIMYKFKDLPVEKSNNCLTDSISMKGMYFSNVETTPATSGLEDINC